MSNRHRLIAVLLLLAVVFSASPAPAQPARAAATRSSFVDTLAAFFADVLARVWGDEGCGVDPLGRCSNRVQPAAPLTSLHAEEGCGADPFGRCLNQVPSRQPSTVTADSGCSIDPFGRCLTSTTISGH